MRNPYEVIYWKRDNYGYAKPVTKRRFKSFKSAYRWAEKMNNRHTCETKYTVNRPRAWVDVYRDGIGIVEELQAVIVPSVGELCYWFGRSLKSYNKFP
jgi:hypothetical protein